MFIEVVFDREWRTKEMEKGEPRGDESRKGEERRCGGRSVLTRGSELLGELKYMNMHEQRALRRGCSVPFRAGLTLSLHRYLGLTMIILSVLNVHSFSE